jgi:hypothetical protein
MTARGRPKAELVVSGSDREALKRLARQPSTPQAIAERARIVLAWRMGRPTRRSPTVSGYQMERQLARRAVRCERIDEHVRPVRSHRGPPGGRLLQRRAVLVCRERRRIYAGAHVAVEDHPVLIGATLVASVDGVAANQAATRIHRHP